MYPVSKWLWGTACSDILIDIVTLHTSDTFGTFCFSSHISNHTETNILPENQWHFIFMWMFQIPTSKLHRNFTHRQHKHVKLLSKWHICIWADNDLKYIFLDNYVKQRFYSVFLITLWSETRHGWNYCIITDNKISTPFGRYKNTTHWSTSQSTLSIGPSWWSKQKKTEHYYMNILC